MEFTIYTDERDLSAGLASGENALFVQKCPVCGDSLLGSPDAERGQTCADNQHRSRPGVFYRNRSIIDLYTLTHYMFPSLDGQPVVFGYSVK